MIPLLSRAISERFRDEVHDEALYKWTLFSLLVCVSLWLQGVSVIGEGGASSWRMIEHEMDEDVELIEASAAAAAKTAVVNTSKESTVMTDSDSEEVNVLVVGSAEASSVPSKPSSKPIDLTKAVKRRRKKKLHMKH